MGSSPCRTHLVLVDEELEGLVQLVVDVLGLASFCHQIVDDGVDAEVQLLDGLLAVLGPSLKRMRHFPDSATRWHCH